MDFERILSCLPEYDFAITYGSGVFRQKGYSDKDVKNAMLDVIIGVKNPEDWHKLNLKQNPQHYSSVRLLGSKKISSLENAGFGHVLYNRHKMGPPGEERPVKYGVISLSALEGDLRDWDSLYVSGRLHKPVRILKADEKVISDMNDNLSSAVLAVLPLLPCRFSDRELFLAITALSYNGDIRTWFAENPHKVENIVSGNYNYFQQLYRPILEDCPYIHRIDGEENMFEQVISLPNLAHILSSLPESLHSPIREELQFKSTPTNITSLPKSELYNLYYKRLECLYRGNDSQFDFIQAKSAIARGITNGVRHAVFRSSIDQAIRGTLSFGILNSVTYTLKKIKKFLK